MFQRSTLTVLSVAIISAGCASKGSSFQPVDGATAQAAGGSLGDSSESSAGGFGSAGGPSFMARFAPGAPGGAGGCQSGSVTRTPANVVDTDQDNTPDTVMYTFANCMFTGSNGSETLNGSLSVVDGTPTTADFDFTASHNITIDLVGAGTHAGENGTVVVTGTRSASGTAAGPTYTMSDATADDATYTNGTDTYHVTDSKTWNVGYTPSTAWTPGAPMVPGAMSLSGSWGVHVNGRGADATLASSGLMISPACATNIVAGSVTATYAGDNGSSTITVTWSGCGQRAVTYTGS